MTDHLHHREALTAQIRQEMFDLLSRHFEGVSREQFECDLTEKNWALLLRDDMGRLVGFTTLHFYLDRFDGECNSIVYSGDTIVDPVAWHSSALSKAWIRAVKALHAQYGTGRLYWLLIVSGFRTYRFLPVYWREYFPRYDCPTPASVSQLMHRLARERFGELYQVETGVVRFTRPQRLLGVLKGIPNHRLDDPHIHFFACANPGHEIGDELVCLTELCDDNLTPAGRRMVGATPPVSLAR